MHAVKRGIMTRPMRTYEAVNLFARYSTEAQGKGTSIERQLGNMEDYIAAKRITGNEPNRVIADEGLSAFHGHHRSVGNFGVFEAEVSQGLHHGELFLCENLDRFSRQGHEVGGDLLRMFISNGVTVETLDGDFYEAGARLDMLQAIKAIVKFELAREESVKKQVRSTNNWRIKREKARRDGTVLTRTLPGWLTVDPETNKAIVNGERGALPLRITCSAS